ncbi:MAG: indole-3-glycerol phosphate synthase TrpC [Gammaproteobacteria bacterium]|nr:indole-3-glycerol phosphate synthase TrpC [Gammaproteobacteria bacterium]MDE0224496.1 indole-3-glycerol phosphate synthase TrpC [Gammaproteobacteria bacterium]
MTVLDRILSHKADELAARRRKRPLADVRAAAESALPARGFAAAIKRQKPAVIAEMKRASPSRGVIRDDFDPAAIAASYDSAGAACLSVLTDGFFFQGSDEHLAKARAASKLPLLRKDFVIDEYQVFEARELGADCVLLIAAALDPERIASFTALAAQLGFDALVEVHNARELHGALKAAPPLLGINNRDLRTFDTSLDTTLSLLSEVPKGTTVVTESGIRTRKDVRRMRDAGVEAFLVGEAFMRARDPGTALRELFRVDATG